MQIFPERIVSAAAPHFLQGLTVIIEHRLVCLKQTTLLIQYNDTLRKHICQLPQLPLALPQFVFSLLPIINIGACTVPADDRAGFIPERLSPDEEPAKSSIMAAKTCFDLARFSRNQHPFPS